MRHTECLWCLRPIGHAQCPGSDTSVCLKQIFRGYLHLHTLRLITPAITTTLIAGTLRQVSTFSTSPLTYIASLRAARVFAGL